MGANNLHVDHAGLEQRKLFRQFPVILYIEKTKKIIIIIIKKQNTLSTRNSFGIIPLFKNRMIMSYAKDLASREIANWHQMKKFQSGFFFYLSWRRWQLLSEIKYMTSIYEDQNSITPPATTFRLEQETWTTWLIIIIRRYQTRGHSPSFNLQLHYQNLANCRKPPSRKQVFEPVSWYDHNWKMPNSWPWWVRRTFLPPTHWSR